ncbi:MAG: hypothetical protein JWL95_3008 [Gemmatimonadetes bacterium]|nr:hypothetical protein [Gemmatimonadota bacterium]
MRTVASIATSDAEQLPLSVPKPVVARGEQRATGG